jgi:hypothetical protein
MLFRVHMSNGKKIDIEADKPADATAQALKKVKDEKGVIAVKTKRVRG